MQSMQQKCDNSSGVQLSNKILIFQSRWTQILRRRSEKSLSSLSLNHAEEADVGLLWVIVLCCFRKKKNLTATDSLERHWKLQHAIFKGDLFFRHLDLRRTAPKTQQFSTGTVVRNSSVALC
jgi:hypothetical protein